MLADDTTVPANIQVVARVRPLSDTELTNGHHSAAVVDVECGTIEVKGSAYHNKSRLFKFHKVFDTGAKQQDIFETCVSPMIDDVLLGYNVCSLRMARLDLAKHTRWKDLHNRVKGRPGVLGAVVVEVIVLNARVGKVLVQATLVQVVKSSFGSPSKELVRDEKVRDAHHAEDPRAFRHYLLTMLPQENV